MTSRDVLNFKLCYVCPRTGFAYFTECDLRHQWGDDWDDAPYEHNAGDPYEHHRPRKGGESVPHRIVKVAWEGEYITPCENHVNSPWSVQGINAGSVAWLIPNTYANYDPDKHPPIHAGTELLQFVRTVEGSGGIVYLPRDLARTIEDACSK